MPDAPRQPDLDAASELVLAHVEFGSAALTGPSSDSTPGSAAELSDADRVRILAMRSHRASLARLGSVRAPASLLASVEDALASETNQQAEFAEATALSEATSIPISQFRIERRSPWERFVSSPWPRRFAVAASVVLVAGLGTLVVSAAMTQYRTWQHDQAKRLAQRGGGSGSASTGTGQTPTPDVSTIGQPNGASAQLTGDTASTTRRNAADATPAPSQVTTSQATASAAPSMRELAEQGRLVFVVRSARPEYAKRAIERLARQSTDILASTSLDSSAQQALAGLVATGAAHGKVAPDAAIAGVRGENTPPIFASLSSLDPARRWGAFGNLGAGPEQSGIPWWVGQDPADVAQLAQRWVAPRVQSSLSIDVRSTSASVERLRRRIAGLRNIKLEVLTLESPSGVALGPSAPTSPTSISTPATGGSPRPSIESSLWWTAPAADWQRVSVPLVILSE